MGCCSTSPDKIKNIELDKELQLEMQKQSKIQKLLFLGSGGSGKSTFFKQLKCIHGSGFSDKDRRVFKEHISAQIIEQINRCVECIPFYNERLPPDYEPIALSMKAQESARYMEEISGEYLVDEQIAHHISILWNEDSIKQIFKNRAIYHIDDSSEYFFNAIDRIGKCDEYLPTDNDILLVRYRTTGVIDRKFDILGSSFHIFDVGGQQSERKKWIHCFENVTAVIFVASLSCYDELMFEDDTINCMHDSLSLFQEICNLQWFVNTPIILFLNKRDLFEKKIQLIPLTVCFPDYKPTVHLNNTQQYHNESKKYIQEKFVKSNNNPKNRQIYVHTTCATDKNNVQNVFNDVQQILVSAGLERNNLI